MVLSAQIGFSALAGTSGAGATAIAGQPRMAGLVDEAATSFMMENPAALTLAQGSLPRNRLWGKYKATNFAELQRSLTDKSAKTKAPSIPAKIASGIISTGVALTPAVISGILTCQITGNVVAGIVAGAGAGANAGAIAGAVAVAGADAGVVASAVVGVVASVVVGVVAGAVAGVVAGVVVGVAVGVAAGVVLLYPWLARFLDGLFSFVTQKGEAHQLKEVETFLANPAEIEHFFAQNPEEYHSFLKGSVSQTFRTKEAEARIRIDALRDKVGEAIRKQEECLREIEVSDIPEADKQLLSERVRTSTQEPMGRFNEAIGKEEAFVEQLNAFIEEISEMAVAIDREVAARNVYASVEQHEAEMKALEETVAHAEEARIKALIDLSAYWQRLREMGDQVLLLQEAHQEVSRMLLNGESL